MTDDERHPAEQDRGPRRFDHTDIEYCMVVGFAGRSAANELVERRAALVRAEYEEE